MREGENEGMREKVRGCCVAMLQAETKIRANTRYRPCWKKIFDGDGILFAGFKEEI